MRLLPPISPAHSAIPILTPSPNTTDKVSFAKQSIEASELDKKACYPTLTGTNLPKAQTEALAAELNALYQEVMDSLGADDARYIQRVYSAVVYSELIARGLLVAAGRMNSWQKGTAT